jgi:hypothetical protein
LNAVPSRMNMIAHHVRLESHRYDARSVAEHRGTSPYVDGIHQLQSQSP